MRNNGEVQRRMIAVALATSVGGLGIAGCASSQQHTGPNQITKSAAPTCDVSFAVPRTAGYTFADQKAAFQAALGQRESRNRWTAVQLPGFSGGNADLLGRGAYMYTPRRWQTVQQAAGYGHRYATAEVAPPAVQYRVAEYDINRVLAVTTNWAQVELGWSGNIDSAKQPACNVAPFLLASANLVIEEMDQFLTEPGAIPPVPGLSVGEYNPALVGK